MTSPLTALTVISEVFMHYPLLLILLSSISVSAELTPIDDSDLSKVDGQNGAAIGFVWDDVYATGEDVKLILDFDSGIPLIFTDFYWVGHDSARKGDDVYGGNVGSYDDPYFLNIQEETVTLVNGETITGTTLVTAFPEGSYKSNNPDAGKMDLGALMTLEHASGNTDETWLLFNGMYLDGTYLKSWAPDGGGLAMSGEINFHADELIFQAATVNNAPSNNLDNAWRITGFDLYLPIGHSLYQPATLSISEDQQVVFEIAAVTSNTAAEFYAAPTGSIRADNITINDWNAGASYIEGIQLQHLKVQTHDLN
jgi:hypothetical protein